MPNVLSRAVKYFVSRSDYFFLRAFSHIIYRWMSESLVKCLKSDTSTAVRSSLLRGKSKGAVDDAASGTAPAPAQDAYFLQTQCSYCITMCEVLSVLGRMEPVRLYTRGHILYEYVCAGNDMGNYFREILETSGEIDCT